MMKRYWSLLILFVLLILSWYLNRKFLAWTTTQSPFQPYVDGIVWVVIYDQKIRHSTLVMIRQCPNDADRLYPNFYQFIRIKPPGEIR